MDMLTAAAGGIPLPHHKPREQLLEELFTVQFWLQLIAILLIPSVVTYISDNSNTGFFKRAYRKWNGEAKRTIRFTFSSDYWANRSQDDRNNILQKAITIYLGQNNCKRVQTLKDGQYRLMQAQDVEENRWGSDKKNSKELKKYKLTPMPQIAQSQEIEPGLWFYYTEEADENAPLGEQAFIHRYEFTAYGRDSRTRIDDFIKRAYNAYLDGLRKELDTGRYLYQMQMSITMDGSKPPTYKKYLLSEDKTFDSLFFEQKNEILKLVDDFTAGRGKFAIEGFPNKLGLLLHGPPGTGKTSFVKALAHRTRRHIVTVPLSKLETNQALYDIMFELVFPTKDDDGVSQQLTFRDIIFLLEDIDASADVVKSRKQDAEERSAEQEEMAALMKWMMGNSNKGNNSAGAGAGGAGETKDAAADTAAGFDVISSPFAGLLDVPDKLDLAGLLNVLDGVVDSPGRIVIMTTNHPEALDPALIRPGRINTKLHMGYMTDSCIVEMFRHHFPEATAADDARVIEVLHEKRANSIPKFSISGAEVEQICAESDTKEEFFVELEAYPRLHHDLAEQVRQYN